jgi:hypothetical protein
MEGAGVELRISLGKGDLSDLEELHDWLCDERELNGRVRATGPEPRAGELGTLTDALIVAVGSGGTISVLAASLRAWLSLPRRSDVRIRISRSDGNYVEIDAKRVDSGELDVQSMIRQALDYGAAGERRALSSENAEQHPVLDSNAIKE